jgi:cell division protein FtsI/penicillin-binding protein 2
VLTIDSTIQHIAQKSLAAAVASFSAKSGIAIVMEPSTGAVLAMAHCPEFNPNDYRSSSRLYMAEPGDLPPVRTRFDHEGLFRSGGDRRRAAARATPFSSVRTASTRIGQQHGP